MDAVILRASTNKIKKIHKNDFYTLAKLKKLWESTGDPESTGPIVRCIVLHVPVPAPRISTRSMTISNQKPSPNFKAQWQSTIQTCLVVAKIPVFPVGTITNMFHEFLNPFRRHFADVTSLQKHLASKLHKKRVRLLKEKPYTLEESRAAGGEGTNSFYQKDATEMLA